jgi:hypothetical protein
MSPVSAVKMWGEDREFEVSVKEEDVVDLDPVRGVIIGRAAGHETTVGTIQGLLTSSHTLYNIRTYCI